MCLRGQIRTELRFWERDLRASCCSAEICRALLSTCRLKSSPRNDLLSELTDFSGKESGLRPQTTVRGARLLWASCWSDAAETIRVKCRVCPAEGERGFYPAPWPRARRHLVSRPQTRMRNDSPDEKILTPPRLTAVRDKV
ncbi:hypothetical protein OJAV_G00167160 [Oryzias javanicus]|uniref:Uncharacterized protein n=1 Tax=Oryzias javanicus TaxID=123683 RepID=A0A3S2LTW6_ORYJA|nr:hypothetical protein OJAV_G00167160 [Oryzias javanicus]